MKPEGTQCPPRGAAVEMKAWDWLELCKNPAKGRVLLPTLAVEERAVLGPSPSGMGAAKGSGSARKAAVCLGP